MFVLDGILKNNPLPDDFGLNFDRDTGTLPPKHRYEYVITIDPGAQSEQDFIPGYRNPDDENRWAAPFDLYKMKWNGCMLPCRMGSCVLHGTPRAALSE